MYFKSTDKGVQADGGLSSGLAMIVCLIVLVSISIRPQRLFNSALQAGNTLSGTLVTETMALFTTNTSTPSNTITREIENGLR